MKEGKMTPQLQAGQDYCQGYGPKYNPDLYRAGKKRYP